MKLQRKTTAGGKMLRWTSALGLLLVVAPSGRAAQVHTADANTIVLWHLDETSNGAGFQDAGALSNTGFAFNASSPVTVFPGAASVPGLTNAVQFRPTLATVGLQRATVVDNVAPFDEGGWTGGSFTLEMWAMGISMTELSTAAPDFGRFLAGDSRWDWSLGLTTNGAFRVRGDPGTIQTAGLTWDSNTWYYIALVADTTGQTPGNALYSFYRGTNFAPSLTLVGSIVGLAVVNDDTGAADTFFVGSGTVPGLV